MQLSAQPSIANKLSKTKSHEQSNLNYPHLHPRGVELHRIILIFGEEQDANLLMWIFRFIIHKAVGIGIIFLIARLYTQWRKIDPWLIAYDKMCNEVMEKPNPMCLDNDKED